MLEKYLSLIEEYYRLIDTASWADGSRDALVRQMDGVWSKLTVQERERAMQHANNLYQRGVAG